jgi:hypothetical protein
MTITSDYVSVKEASQATGVSRARIHQLISGYKDVDEKRGVVRNYPSVVPAVKLGRDWFIKKDDLRLIEERRRAGWPKGLPRKKVSSQSAE